MSAKRQLLQRELKSEKTLTSSQYKFKNFRLGFVGKEYGFQSSEEVVVADCTIAGKKCLFFLKAKPGAYNPILTYNIAYKGRVIFSNTSASRLIEGVDTIVSMFNDK